MTNSFKNRANRVAEMCEDKEVYLKKIQDMDLDELRSDLTCLTGYIHGDLEQYSDVAHSIRHSVVEMIKIKANI